MIHWAGGRLSESGWPGPCVCECCACGQSGVYSRCQQSGLCVIVWVGRGMLLPVLVGIWLVCMVLARVGGEHFLGSGRWMGQLVGMG